MWYRVCGGLVYAYTCVWGSVYVSNNISDKTSYASPIFDEKSKERRDGGSI